MVEVISIRRSGRYNTRQREEVLRAVASFEGRTVSAAQLVAHFRQMNTPIGRTTIFRHLDKLTEDGLLRKCSAEGLAGARYQLMQENCAEHFHLQCENCGELWHLECDALREIRRHMLSEHAFCVDGRKTVLHGTCEECRNLCKQGDNL